MGTLFTQTWHPRPGEAIPVACEEIRAIRRETGDDHFFMWRGRSGGWVVGYRMKDGSVFSAAFLGEGERPTMTRGTIGSLKSMKATGLDGASTGNYADARRELAEQQRARVRRGEELNEKAAEEKRYLRRGGLRGVVREHPMLKG